MAGHKSSGLWLVAVAGILARPATAAIELDLRMADGDWVAWSGGGQELLGTAVQVGDVNGDGLHDVVAGAPFGDGTTPGGQEGRVTVFLGPVGIPGSTDLLSETPSVELRGDGTYRFGMSVELLDLSRDGFDEILVGSQTSGPGGRIRAGAVFVFRGRANWPSVITSAEADWVFYGADAGDDLRVATGGDINDDGEQDLILGAPYADGPGETRMDSGELYIFFGPPSRWARVYDLKVDSPNLQILGADGVADNATGDGDRLGYGTRVLVADILGDPRPDLIVGAYAAAGRTNRGGSVGEVYVLHGRTTWPAVVDLRDPGASDFTVFGPSGGTSFERISLSTSAVGDFDADGTADLILGACAPPIAAARARSSPFTSRKRRRTS